MNNTYKIPNPLPPLQTSFLDYLNNQRLQREHHY